MYDVIIIGKGPAGISASLYTARANLKTLVIGKNSSALGKASKIENYYGFSEPVSGEFLLQEGEKQARNLGIEIVPDDVIGIERNDFYEVITSGMTYTAKAIILSTGQPQKKIKIENLEKFEGNGVSYCTTCDGFFYKGLKVGVLGFTDFAVHEAIELEAFTKDITLFTNGMELQLTEKFAEDAYRFKVNTRPVSKLDGTEYLQSIYFKDGTMEEIDGIFVAYESATSADFARKLGIMTEGNSIVVDQHQRTNLEGFFAAGDCTGGFKQISTAVGQGAMAGRGAIEYVRNLKEK
ncbi:MAG: NAD(P)/FAD-dependent oxidoreductase [Clostridia bacterium]|nr:NAD(P)/FAD-dependent oxidoreductase [Clostridia bacterium]